jgi:hypothetical protein
VTGFSEYIASNNEMIQESYISRHVTGNGLSLILSVPSIYVETLRKKYELSAKM